MISYLQPLVGINIAIIMTCHNRRETTLTCLRHLYSQDFALNNNLSVYLVDDGSEDGTSKAVSDEFPLVNCIRGDGSLYWSGGMRKAWKFACEAGSFEYFFWLNDDTFLKPGAISEMIMTAQNYIGIVVGSCHDPKSKEWTYGGRATMTGQKSLSGTPVIPNSTVQKCQLINGNIVLVPKSVVECIGILSDSFTHAIGDIDFGFRALDANIPLYIAPGYQATCIANAVPAWCNPATSLWKRLTLLNDPKGVSFVEFMIFCHRHFGIKYLLIGFKVITRLLLPGLWNHKPGRKS